VKGNGYTTGRAVALAPQVRALIATRGIQGMTVAELRDIATDHHHGTLSGSLSNLHRDGELALLNDKRNRCRIYVLPEFVNGRDVRPHGGNHVGAIAA